MGNDRWFSISFWACCALLVVPLWSVDYLPMVDLPQHAGQIGIWTRWTDPTFGYQEIYTRNWFTPYLLGYLIAFALTAFMSVKAALTTIITLAVVGLPVATLALLRETRANPWWVFAVFPGVFGFAFDWGFFNFLVGIPIAIGVLIVTLRYADRPTRRGGLILTALLLGLFFVHALLFGYVALILGVTVLLKREDWRTGLISLTPAIVVCPVVLRLAVRHPKHRSHDPLGDDLGASGLRVRGCCGCCPRQRETRNRPGHSRWGRLPSPSRSCSAVDHPVNPNAGSRSQ